MPRNTPWDSFGIWRHEEENDRVPPRAALDAFFQALARRKISKLCLHGDLHPQVLQSLALYFRQERRRGGNDKLEELFLDEEIMAKPDPSPLCSLLFIAKKIFVRMFFHTNEAALKNVFQNMRRALQPPPPLQIQGGEDDFSDNNNNSDALTIGYDFGSGLHTHLEESVAFVELSNLSRDFPFIDYEIKFHWYGQYLPKFISGIPKLKSLTLELRRDFRRGEPFAAGPFQYRALSTEYCNDISNAIRESCFLENITLSGELFYYNAYDYGEGCNDLIKALVAGLDKNKSLRELVIGEVHTGFHQDLWSALE